MRQFPNTAPGQASLHNLHCDRDIPFKPRVRSGISRDASAPLGHASPASECENCARQQWLKRGLWLMAQATTTWTSLGRHAHGQKVVLKRRGHQLP